MVVSMVLGIQPWSQMAQERSPIFEHQFLYLQNRDENTTYVIISLSWLNELSHVKGLVQYLTLFSKTYVMLLLKL